MAGDIEVARKVCHDFCDELGWCVTVTPTTYVYRGREEAGFIVGAINYARFPAPLARAEATMRLLASRWWSAAASSPTRSSRLPSPCGSRGGNIGSTDQP